MLGRGKPGSARPVKLAHAWSARRGLTLGRTENTPVTIYHVTKIQELMEEEEIDEETKRKVTEKVVSCLLIDDNEVQVMNEEDF